MEDYIKRVIENESRLGELRSAQLEGVRYKFGKRVYAVSLAKLKKHLEIGKEYDLLLLASRVNPSSLYGAGYNFHTYSFEDESKIESVVNSFKYYNCNDEVGNRVNVYIK